MSTLQDQSNEQSSSETLTSTFNVSFATKKTLGVKLALKRRGVGSKIVVVDFPRDSENNKFQVEASGKVQIGDELLEVCHRRDLLLCC